MKRSGTRHWAAVAADAPESVPWLHHHWSHQLPRSPAPQAVVPLQLRHLALTARYPEHPHRFGHQTCLHHRRPRRAVAQHHSSTSDHHPPTVTRPLLFARQALRRIAGPVRRKSPAHRHSAPAAAGAGASGPMIAPTSFPPVRRWHDSPGWSAQTPRVFHRPNHRCRAYARQPKRFRRPPAARPSRHQPDANLVALEAFPSRPSDRLTVRDFQSFPPSCPGPWAGRMRSGRSACHSADSPRWAAGRRLAGGYRPAVRACAAHRQGGEPVRPRAGFAMAWRSHSVRAKACRRQPHGIPPRLPAFRRCSPAPAAWSFASDHFDPRYPAGFRTVSGL
jgi:hypothetical protein